MNSPRFVRAICVAFAGAALPIAAGTAQPAVTSAPRVSICLNGEWEIAPATDEVSIPTGGWTSARIPAAPILDPKVTAQWCRLAFSIPKEWAAADRRFFVEFEKVGHYAAVFCNGRKVGEHFGQYSPFEFDLTDALHPGERNELAVFVHNAAGKFVRPGVDITEDVVGNAYRPAANQQSERNWVGISGDVTLSWRPLRGIGDVFVNPSVRQKTLSAMVEMHPPETGAAPGKLRATVLDGGKPVLELPTVPVGSDGRATLTRPWENPTLWGSAPYGEPKLYTLRTELLSADGAVLDRTFTRFGFREVWVSGQDVMLNGKKLWMAGTYFSKHSPIRDLNDRHPIAAMINVMRNAGLNTVHGHWDDLGRTWLDLCDEMGMLVVAGFSCDGRPQIQSRADDAWAGWMTATCGEWAQARRGHPSIVAWRPIDVPPPQYVRFISLDDLHAALDTRVRKNDPSHRPIADGSDIAAWGQPPTDKDTGEYNNFGQLQAGHDSGKPFLCKEIYGGFNVPTKYSAFAEEFYRRSFALGSTGMLVQQLPLLRNQGPEPFAISWLSLSGCGNRNTSFAGGRSELPNWCDSHATPSAPTPFATLFHRLFQKYTGTELQPALPISGEVLFRKLPARSFAMLIPEEDATAEPRGLLAAPDGTAWFTAIPAGPWKLTSEGKTVDVDVRPGAAPPSGYSNLQPIDIPSP